MSASLSLRTSSPPQLMQRGPPTFKRNSRNTKANCSGILIVGGSQNAGIIRSRTKRRSIKPLSVVRIVADSARPGAVTRRPQFLLSKAPRVPLLATISPIHPTPHRNKTKPAPLSNFGENKACRPTGHKRASGRCSTESPLWRSACRLSSTAISLLAQAVALPRLSTTREKNLRKLCESDSLQ